MNAPKLLSSLGILLLSLITGHHRVDGYTASYQKRQSNWFGFKPKSLFVFGDSYADTGNNPIKTAYSWKFPYGITFPGKPTGRYSDGLVSTDILSKFLGIRSPIPWRWRNYAPKQLKYGVNFAHGGAGVFDTIYRMPNTTVQIHFFEKLIRHKLYSASDLMSSAALFSIAGNDYATYFATDGTEQGLKSFITRVVNQQVLDVKRIQGLGVRKVALAALPPLGCLPQATAATGFRRCNETTNTRVNLHNVLLRRAIARLNKETKDPAFVILDLYKAFLTVLENKGVPGSIEFRKPLRLRPCCVGISSKHNCGSVDKSGAKKYILCKDLKSAFFWDNVHPSQQAWRAVYSLLLSNSTLI